MFIIATTRFNTETWKENVKWRKAHQWSGCIYGTPKRVSEVHLPQIPMFVLEMHNDKNKIKGVGLVKNAPVMNQYHKIYSDGTDLIFVRELTGGIYFGKRDRKNNGESAFDTCEYDREEIIRLAKKGFEIAGKRKKKLCCVDKANVLETSRLWRETIQSMENDYPSIEVSYELVDAVAMRLIQSPKNYDVLVTENLFGDILTDEASVISGSMGLMPSASIGELNSLYEPIHGSFPEATGKNIANPLATILSAAMMLEMSFDLKLESDLIKKSVERSIKEGFVTEDLSIGERYFSTSEVGDKISNYIKSS